MKIIRILNIGIRAVAKGFGVVGRATIALVGICGVGAVLANYAMTQGSGTSFGSIIVSTIHYAQMLSCDPVTPSQCGLVTATGGQIVDVASSNNQLHTDLTSAVPAGTNLIGKVGIDQTTPGTTNGVQVNAALPAGANLIGKTGIDQTTPGTTNGVQVNAALPAGSNSIGTVQPGNTPNTTPWLTTDAAGTSGGASSSYLQPTASDNHANIKSSAGTVYSIHTSNNSATKNYLRLYDAGAAFNGCNSATGLIFGMEIPPNDSGFSVILGGSKGLAFATGLSICVTSGYGSTDTTNATATAIMSNVIYK